MRRILSILVCSLMSLSMPAGIHSYVSQSRLAEGKWVKIRVSETGVCRMSFSELQNAGITPQQVRVFGFGGGQLEQNFLKDKIDDLPQVPVYIGSDYILFWAQGPISWTYNGTRFTHTRNTYSDFGYYFLTDNVGSLLPFPEGEAVEGTSTEVSSYLNYQVHDFDSINLIDRSGISGGGRTFYGEQFRSNQTRTFTFNTPNAIAGEQNNIRIEVAANSSTASYFMSRVNNSEGQSVYIRPVPDFYTFGCTGTITSKEEAVADKQQVHLTLQNSSASAMGWLNYIEITTPTALKMVGNQLPIRTNVNYQSSVPVRFHLNGASEGIQIWDVTHLDAIHRVQSSLSGSELTWTGSQADGIHEYVAVNPNGSQWVKAEVVGEVKNQNLHALKNIDYVIICPEGYEAVSTDLAKAHEAKEAITWTVVTDQQVYNEFSSGTPDATAYRWLMKMLYDRADGNGIQKPRWLLLMGHGSFDNRKLLASSGTSLLLTYQAKNSENEVNAYATDDYFGFLDDNEGEADTQGRMDIGVGRLTVESVEEARGVVDKLIRYIRNEQTGKWKNQLIFLADDGEHGTHTDTAEGSAERVRLKNPDFVVNKIYLDAYPQEVNASGESYPLAKNRLTNMLKSGALFFGYSGHGGYNAITNESILNIKDIELMNNPNQAFWLFATCNFAQCDAGKRSAAEMAVLNPNGGAIGVLAATRTVYATPNTELYRSVTDTLFGHKNEFNYNTTLGEAVSIGKNRLGTDMNKMAYVLLGDPAMRLNFPTDYYVETTTKIDTLNALSVQKVEGRIIDEDHQVVSDFNGQVDVTIYDKMQVIKTRDNDDGGTEEAKEIEYNDYPNTIFSGSTAVKDGLFNYTFMVPKDIRYNYGNGRIVYYAVTKDEGETKEAVGHFEQFIVGGTGKSMLVDTVGPQMFIYLNSKSFKDGDVTYATPRFFADLYDENGINTAGAGIGHDLMMIIDNDPKKIYSLNEYFTSANNSYQSGQVSYLMEQLPNGPHSLTFRAWDLLNNSTSQSLNFIIDSSLDPSISSVTTYPNPVNEQSIVNIVVDYNQPDELLQTEVYLFTMSGQMVWSHKQNNPDQVSINLPSIGLQSGVYIYNVKIKSASSKYSSMSGKIIVTK
ncbi:MAG: type IX secretion system sortase PorU [Paludibacteraceae bacterium]|nr:type IX secretion system sortase PorU [Paludibacteraceae bacterium]